MSTTVGAQQICMMDLEWASLLEKGLWAKASSCMNMLTWCSEVKEEAEIFGSV